MASYHKKAEVEQMQKHLDVFTQQQSEHETYIDEKKIKHDEEHAVWKATHDGWQVEHDEWEKRKLLKDVSEEEEYEPVEPVEPEPLSDPLTPYLPVEELPVYEARIVEQFEEIETPTGPALITPGRVIVTAPDGQQFAVSPEELYAHYTLIKESV
jgi:hypothetical protein